MPLIIYGNIFFVYVSKIVLSLNINMVNEIKIIPIIKFIILCDLIDFSGILLDIV